MIVKRHDRKKHVNSPLCIAYEYGLRDKDMNIAVIELSGRYPSKGRVINKVCKEVALVIEGRGRVEIDGKQFLINEGDSILIKPKEKFFWEGKMKIAMTCYPAFYPAQHIECD